MIGSLVRARKFVTKRPIGMQIWKTYCEGSGPSQKDFLSKSIGGDPYYAVPFQFRKPVRFTITFLLFLGIPFWLPPIVVHLQLYKRQLGD